ncbi:MAG: hypothetical protein B7Z80_02220 [Rhodospirillales bacterium 20-64-7]|nr:MAG: hypothetical protein B7Z80_02220 [Rhodospirillales bacterium 20-64-7]
MPATVKDWLPPVVLLCRTSREPPVPPMMLAFTAPPSLLTACAIPFSEALPADTGTCSVFPDFSVMVSEPPELNGVEAEVCAAE